MSKEGIKNLGLISVLLTLIGVGTKALGFIRELIISSRFGASEETDAFYLVFALLVVNSLTIISQLPRAFVPEYQKRAHGSAHAGSTYFGATLILLVPLLLALAVVIWVWTEPIIRLTAPGFSGLALTESIALTHILAVLLPVAALTAVLSSLAQARGHLLLVQLATPLLNLGTIVGLLTLGNSLGIRAAAVGIVLGSLAQLLVVLLYPFLQRLKPTVSREALRPALKGVGVLVLLVVLNYTGGVLATVVERVFSSRLPEGHLSCMGYAIRLLALPNGVFLGGLLVALLPAISNRVVHQDPAEIHRITLRALRMLLLLQVPILCGMTLFAGPLVDLVYGRGAFSADDGALTASLFVCYLPSILTEVVCVVLVTLYFAYSLPTIPFLFGLFRVVLLGITFAVTWERFGAHGMALSQSAVDIVVTGTLLILARRRFGIPFANLLPFLIRLSILSTVALSISVGLWKSLNGFAAPGDHLIQILLLLTAGAGGIITYVLLAPKIGLHEVSELLGLLRKTARRFIPQS